MRAHIPLSATILALLTSSACRENALDLDESAETHQEVVYGADNRVDVYDTTDEHLPIADALGALMDTSSLVFTPQGNVNISANTLGQEYDLCPSERFRDQPSASWCSSTLIDDDLVLTAGHCVDQGACGDVAIVFDYLYRTPDETLDINFVDDVYFCQEVLVSFDDGEIDYAVIRLDRPAVFPHVAVDVSTALTALGQNQAITLAGFPSGLPAKFADGARVIDARANQLDFFRGTPDAFSGNSGSGVFNDDGTLVGILVRGEQDYTFDFNDGCFRVNVLPETGNAGTEEMTYAARAIEALCDTGEPTSLCANEPEICEACGPGNTCGASQSCLNWGDNPNVTFCAPSCSVGNSCPSGHTCSPLGFCTPNRGPSCVGGDVWDVDSCGNAIVKTAECGNNLCVNGTCQSSTSGDTCASPASITAVSQVLTGSLIGLSNDGGGSCGTSGPDRIYTFTLATAANLVATASGFDTLLHLRRTCQNAQTEVACDDDGGNGTDARIDVDLESGTYFLYMDSWSSTVGNYNLSLTFTPVCGDGCEPGLRICEGGGFRECSVDTDCPSFGPVQFCSMGETCQNGECGPPCDDECEEEGAQVCLSDTIIGFCGQFDDDGCLDLVEIDECPGGLQCNDGFCEGCPFICNEGQQRCLSTTIRQTCVDPDGDGCFTWGQNNPCPDETECNAGTCLSTCESTCTIGERRCVDDNTEEVCVLGQSDCPAFVSSSCGPNAACVDGVGCDIPCDGGCTLGDRRCIGDVVERCTTDVDGCTVFTTLATCPSGTMCNDGSCEGACTDECNAGDARCVGVTRIDVCVDDFAQCAVWADTATCAGGRTCVDGTCTGPCLQQCTPGVEKCASDHAAIACVSTSEGCAVWNAPTYCFGNDVCSEGACVPAPDAGVVTDGGLSGPDDGETPDRVRIASRSGCQSTDATPLGGLALLLLIVRRRPVRNASSFLVG